MSSFSDRLTTPSIKTDSFQWQGYRCEYDWYAVEPESSQTPLLLIHPIGVGLSRRFWDRFCNQWFDSGHRAPIYRPDLLGCGNSDMPHVAYTPADWALQLNYFVTEVIRRPVVVVVQGALLPAAIALVQQLDDPSWVKGLVLAGPPAWAVMTQSKPLWQQRLSWNLFDSPLGAAFYRYARRRDFLASFSSRQLFASSQQVDEEWLTMLKAGAADLASRHAVFSFLAGFWREDYTEAIAHISQPTLVVLGETASSISRSGKSERPQQRMTDYLNHLPQGEGQSISGRNVLPYESTTEFVNAIAPFVQKVA